MLQWYYNHGCVLVENTELKTEWLKVYERVKMVVVITELKKKEVILYIPCNKQFAWTYICCTLLDTHGLDTNTKLNNMQIWPKHVTFTFIYCKSLKYHVGFISLILRINYFWEITYQANIRLLQYILFTVYICECDMFWPYVQAMLFNFVLVSKPWGYTREAFTVYKQEFNIREIKSQQNNIYWKKGNIRLYGIYRF